MPYAIRVHDLWKSYTAGVAGCSSRVWALRGCALEVSAGERVAIVGRRGAGKTTLLHCLAGNRRADAGSIDVKVAHRCYVDSLAQLADLSRAERLAGPALLLVDDDGLRQPSPIRGSGRPGDVIILAARDVACVQGLVDRVLLLTDGRLIPFTRTIVRQVAERSVATGEGTTVVDRQPLRALACRDARHLEPRPDR